MSVCGPRRITGGRNLRQALASPLSGLFVILTAAFFYLDRQLRGEAVEAEIMRSAHTKLVAMIFALGIAAAGCAVRAANIAEVKFNPGRYVDRTIEVEGVVTESWGIPLVPYKLYKVDDGTGEITVVSHDNRVPSKGARVKVRGKLKDVATLGGRSLGLHIEQSDLDFRDARRY